METRPGIFAAWFSSWGDRHGSGRGCWNGDKLTAVEKAGAALPGLWVYRIRMGQGSRRLSSMYTVYIYQWIIYVVNPILYSEKMTV